ncbi:MAG: hypothetical protein ACR2JB_24720 [Bryobacteraceae bacterium]
MADIRRSTPSNTSDGKVTFDAESVAGDLWMRQNHHGIHVELDTQKAQAFAKNAKDAGLTLETMQPAST